MTGFPAPVPALDAPLSTWFPESRWQHIRVLVNPTVIDNGTAGLFRVGEPIPDADLYFVVGDGLRAVLFGFLPPVHRRTRLRILADPEGSFRVSCDVLVQERLPRFDRYPLEQLLVLEDAGGDAGALLADYGARWRTTRTAERAGRPPIIGWSSWDYYLSSIDAQALDENLFELAEMQRQDVPATHAVVDDGWFVRHGDWKANGKFGGDVGTIAASMHREGFLPGVWSAPFLVDVEGDALPSPPGRLARTAAGDVARIWRWGIVDVTDPQTAVWLGDIYRRLHDSGFRYFKLDFLHHPATFDGLRFSDEGLPRLEIIRLTLRIIREAVGEDSYLVACGCPPAAAAGLCDACRIGGDIAAFHSTVRIQARFLAVRHWMDDVLFRCDPDFLLLRSAQTSDEEERNPFLVKEMGETFADAAGSRSGGTWTSEGEVRIWGTLVGLSGGDLFLADRLRALNHKAREMLALVVRHAHGPAAVPQDLLEEDPPASWLRGGDRPSAAIVNFTEERRTLSVDVSGAHAGPGAIWRDLWSGRLHREEGGRIEACLPPRDAIWFVPETSGETRTEGGPP